MNSLFGLFVGLVTVAVVVGCTQTSDRTPIASSVRPNIVFILADDLGMGDTSLYGSEIIRTPSIDALAKRGIVFSSAYVTHPVCSPSRAGLITGRYQQRHGWEFNAAGRDVDIGMSLSEKTIADVLKEADYATGMVGKWHLGYEGAYHPQRRGFDEYFGVLAGGSIFIDSNEPGVESLGTTAATRNPRIAVYRGHETVEVNEYLTDVFTREAVDFIDRHQDEPFFLYLSHTTPHTPLQATERYLSDYQHIDDKATRIYAAMVSSLDSSVGAVVAKLREIGQLENTLIVFTSDNGCAGYIGGACTNKPFAGFKRYHQEGGIRVPMVMSWPATLTAGTEYQAPVLTLDLMQTFASAAGVGGSDEVRLTQDSVDLVPHLRGEANSTPHDYLYWRSGPTIAIRDDRWKLIKYNKSPLTLNDLRSDGRLEPPADGWSTDSPNGQLTLLYDLEADPAETTNVAADHVEVVGRLEKAHEEWAETLVEPILPGIRSTLVEVHGETVQLIF